MRFLERGLAELVDRGPAHGGIRREKFQGREHCFERAAHPVVVGDVFGAVGQRRLLAAGRVGRLAVVNDQHLAGRDLHLVGEQRLHEGREFRVALRGHRAQRGDAGIVVAGRDRGRFGAGQRMSHAGGKQQRDEE